MVLLHIAVQEDTVLGEQSGIMTCILYLLLLAHLPQKRIYTRSVSGKLRGNVIHIGYSFDFAANKMATEAFVTICDIY